MATARSREVPTRIGHALTVAELRRSLSRCAGSAIVYIESVDGFRQTVGEAFPTRTEDAAGRMKSTGFVLMPTDVSDAMHSNLK